MELTFNYNAAQLQYVAQLVHFSATRAEGCHSQSILVSVVLRHGAAHSTCVHVCLPFAGASLLMVRCDRSASGAVAGIVPNARITE